MQETRTTLIKGAERVVVIVKHTASVGTLVYVNLCGTDCSRHQFNRSKGEAEGIRLVNHYVSQGYERV